MSRDEGWSLFELLVVLILIGLVTSSVSGLLLRAFRSVREQADRASVDAAVQQSVALFHAELRGLDTSDSVRPDLVVLGQSSIVYKPVRTLRFLCRRPDTSTATITTWPPFFGLRDLRADLDSVLLLVMSLDTEFWIAADLLDVAPGTCRGGSPGVALRVAGPTPNQLSALLPGAPLVGGEVAEIRSYRDGRGRWWLGMRRFAKSQGRWPSIQPVLGPLAPGGFELSYLGRNGGLVTNHTDVARIRVRIRYGAADPHARWGNSEAAFDVALRGRGWGR